MLDRQAVTVSEHADTGRPGLTLPDIRPGQELEAVAT